MCALFRPPPSASPVGTYKLARLTGAEARSLGPAALPSDLGRKRVIELRSLVSGIYYEPGVEQGGLGVQMRVKKGQLLGIIEMWGVETVVRAPCDGTLEALYVHPGQAVELDQRLLLLRL